MKQVRLNPNTDRLLTEMSDKRKADKKLVISKQSIIAELVMNQHKKECK